MMDRAAWLQVIGALPRPAADLDPQWGPPQPARGHVRRHVRFRSDDRTIVTAWLLDPDTPLPGHPALICVHGYGHFEYGKAKVAGLAGGLDLEWSSQAVDAALAGFTVLAPDMHGFEERRPAVALQETNARYYGDANYLVQETLRLALSGSSYQARCLADLRACADLIEQLDAPQPRPIGCFGHSFGGWETLFALFLDPRIRAGACSCGVTLLADIAAQDRPFGLQAFLPGLLARGDMDDLFDHIAPKPLCLLFGARDRLTRPGPTERIVARARQAYSRVPQQLDIHVHDQGHWFGPPMRQRVLDLLARWLVPRQPEVPA